MVAVDVDGTIAATSELLHRRYGVPLDIYPSPLPEGFWESREGLEVFRDVEPIPCAAEALRLVKDLIYVTIRPKIADFITARWLQKHGFPEAPIYFCRNLQEKGLVAKQLGVVAAFDDDPNAPAVYASRMVPAVIIARPYNSSVTAPRATWEEILKEGLHAARNDS